MELLYGSGWDPARGTLRGALSVEQARRRAESGKPHSVLVVAGDRPYAVADLAGRRGYCSVWAFDDAGRRTIRADFRQLEPGRMFLGELERWRYVNGQGEGAADAWHSVARFRVDRPGQFNVRPQGTKGWSSNFQFPVESDRLWQPWPVFGQAESLNISVPLEALEPERLINSDTPVEPINVALFTPSDAPVDPIVLKRLTRPDDEPSTPLWHVPTPMPAADFDAWFTDGARFRVPNGEGTVRLVQVGELRMPTGRLIAAEPGGADEDFVPFATTVAPGTYPVTAAMFDWDPPPESHAWPGSIALRLEIRPDRVESWELAIRPGQDVRLLNDDEFFGFGVDGGRAGFFDEAARSTALVDPRELYDGLEEIGYAQLRDPQTGANVLVVNAIMGDGSYSTWIGRTAAGEIACFVIDLELLRRTGDEVVEKAPPVTEPPPRADLTIACDIGSAATAADRAGFITAVERVFDLVIALASVSFGQTQQVSARSVPMVLERARTMNRVTIVPSETSNPVVLSVVIDGRSVSMAVRAARIYSQVVDLIRTARRNELVPAIESDEPSPNISERYVALMRRVSGQEHTRTAVQARVAATVAIRVRAQILADATESRAANSFLTRRDYASTDAVIDDILEEGADTLFDLAGREFVTPP